MSAARIHFLAIGADGQEYVDGRRRHPHAMSPILDRRTPDPRVEARFDQLATCGPVRLTLLHLRCLVTGHEFHPCGVFIAIACVRCGEKRP